MSSYILSIYFYILWEIKSRGFFVGTFYKIFLIIKGDLKSNKLEGKIKMVKTNYILLCPSYP